MPVNKPTQEEVLARLRQNRFLPEAELTALTQSERPKVAAAALRRLELQKREIARLTQMSSYETKLYHTGLQYIAGLDEVGRGPLAGPVVAGCVILPQNCLIYGLNDSKKLSPTRRLELSSEIKEHALAWSIGLVEPVDIDRYNILQATYQAMRQAILHLPVSPQHLLIDALTLPLVDMPQTAIIHGDALSVSIAAASIIAKCYRDDLMEKYDAKYPQYGFAKHKGYGTAEHVEALARYGPSPIHRQSFIVKSLSADKISGGLASQGRGRSAEEAACHFLKQKGHGILERNFLAAGAEIDIISQKNNEYYFIEVKARGDSSLGAPTELIGADKRNRLRRGAVAFLNAQNGENKICHFVLLAVHLSSSGEADNFEFIEDDFYSFTC